MSLQIDLAVARGTQTIEARIDVPPQGITALIGRSGAGKSSLLMAAAGLLVPLRGTVVLDGEPLFDRVRGIDCAVHRRRFGLVFQDGRLFPHRSVRANLLYGARRAPATAPGPGFDEVVALLGIEPLLARRPHQLSGGERQRVAIGRALLGKPRALLMDEPLASLDPARRHELLGYLAQLPARLALPILYVTHQMDEVMRLADRVVLLSEGRVAASGAALELLSDLRLGPLVGRFEAGSVLAARVVEAVDAWALSVVEVAGQRIVVPRIEAAAASLVRLRVRARDVALQREVLPSSASNQLRGSVLQVIERDPPYAAVELGLAGPDSPPGERLWSLVTRRSVHALAIAPGQDLVASFKAVAVEGRATAVQR
ncbi:MAG TPA: molybdenum ABC transporter ATP-binding protein [Methylibium sp.]|uniref:molybdenum ABC transporter ATP-binding protein n=1 Tax=Methylibium sp. TaxID=2067992 RepID=UPI002DB6B2DB|nr:molybdenum ABC transporter ATP-binding protein [Methylibium sp.]HEU4458518.1 molybdenum ABC transporter ATP-binding protein [Methylibium sp.]